VLTALECKGHCPVHGDWRQAPDATRGEHDRIRTGGPPARRRTQPRRGHPAALLADYSAADAFRTTVTLHGNARLRQVRVVRDYGMYDRRENPQYYTEVARP
jgi:hypothetical protein